MVDRKEVLKTVEAVARVGVALLLLPVSIVVGAVSGIASAILDAWGPKSSD